jgi:hypothetical protein
MENKDPVKLTIDTKFGLAGKAILRCLYGSQDRTLGTKELMKILRPQQIEGEQEQQAYEEIQAAVEN